jgi:L-iditol 2-dehydrogenase
MKAAVYRGAGDLRIEEVPVPPVGAGEMLVRVDACGICGTDIKKIQKGLLAGPRIFGHEIAGTVVTPPSTGRFREGDRVALHHHVPCLECFYCARGAHAQCEGYKRNGTTAGFEAAGGGFAEYVKAHDWIVERGAIAIPDGVRPEEAAFVEPVNTCLKAVRKAGVGRGQTVLVVGQGPIGLLLMQICRWAGADVITSDTMDDRMALSRRLGASAVVDARGNVPAEIRGMTSGRGADLAIVAAVGGGPFRQAIDAVRPAGRIMMFAATSPGETAELDLGALCAAEKEILTSYSASVDVQDLAAQLVFGREIRVLELVTHRLPLADAARAVDLASRPAPGVLKVVLQDQGQRGELLAT